MFVPDLADGIGDAVDVLNGPLCDGPFALTAESGDRPIGTSVIDRVGRTCQVLEAYILDPVLRG